MNNIKRIVLTADKPISKAIEAIQESNIKIVIIVSKKNKILGTITDGDIRRGLLKGKDLSNKCNEIMNPNPKFATVNDFENIERLLSTEKYVPIVDTDQTIKDILTSEDKIKKGNLDNPVVIMAGGEGKRLMPLTLSTPKPLLPIKQKPLIREIINRLSAYGLRDIYISVHYKAKKMTEYFEEDTPSGTNIKFLEEQKPLGTAGCLSFLKNKGIDKHIIVINGDVLTNINYRQLVEFHNKSKKMITVCAAIYDIQIPFGTIEFDGNSLICIDEKPIKKHLINAGIYIINPEVLETMEDNKSIDMTDIIQNHTKTKSVGIFPLHEQWLDIGNHENYEKAQKE